MPTVVSSPWLSAVPVPRRKLVKKVCDLLGLSDEDPDFVQVALDSLDDTINDMNTALFEFNKSVEQGIVMTANQPYVVVTDLFYRESQCYLTPNSGGQGAPLDYLDWIKYQRWFGDDTNQGCPERYSLFNNEREGRVYLSPTPDTTTVSDQTLTIEFYRRIPLVSTLGAENSLTVPREVESALVYGAQKRIAIHVLGAAHPDVGSLAGFEMQALERLKRVDKTHPDEHKRMILADFGKRTGRSRARNTAYIRI